MSTLAASTMRALTLPATLLFFVVHMILSIVLADFVMGGSILVLTLLGWKLTMRKLQSSFLQVWMSSLIGFIEIFGGLTLVVTGDDFVPEESCLFVSNHRSWTDTIAIYSVARQVGAHGYVKFFAKFPLIFFPVYGLAGHITKVVIFIQRSAESATRHFQKAFSFLRDPKAQHPFWMISYLEGTRLTVKKLEDAQAFAKKRDLRVLNHVLQPRVKGFISMVHELRPVTSAVYDITIGYKEDPNTKEPTPPFTTYLLDYCQGQDRIIHVHQRRIPMNEVPEDEDELKNWIYKLYTEKDELLEQFYKTGHFPGQTVAWERMTTSYAISCYALTVVAAVVTIVFTYFGIAFARHLIWGDLTSAAVKVAKGN
eukprot:CAMPEP_0184705248 /NCGR_PEP_ID=MMETSP0313-20130426/33763_1 /TAXON_ID=2792 /ORGANISM="Porphyridium aerugineum, Strain SAG 1380-2" /LENGTH=367 /DNA_ID=CAMNT_0027166543 /DNA_START=38 /DNA_END=1141 /DNA_ORIENTATION=+